MPDGRRVSWAALSPGRLRPGKETQPPPQHPQGSTSGAQHPHLFDVYQLGLVDLRDGDVVLGSDGEAPLGKAEAARETGAPPPPGTRGVYRAASLASASVPELPVQLLTMSV